MYPSSRCLEELLGGLGTVLGRHNAEKKITSISWCFSACDALGRTPLTTY